MQIIHNKALCSLTLFALGLGLCSTAWAGSITKTNTFTSGTAISASQVNTNFDQLFTEINAKDTRMSTLESQWTTGSGNVYYSGAGNVGVGTSSPQATLDVNGTVRLTTNAAAPATCTAARAGSLALNSVYQTCVCNGALWVLTSDGSTACSWTGNTTILMHMEGANNSTTFTDEYSHTATANGAAAISTAQSKFGSSSGVFTTAGTNYVSFTNTTDQNLGMSDFTIELWLYLTAVNLGYQGILSKPGSQDSNGFLLLMETNNALYFYSAFSANSWDGFIVNWSTVPTANTWYHIAIVRKGAVVTMYVNGVARSTSTKTAISIIGNTSNGVRVGAYPYIPGGSKGFSGYIDDLRITIGLARYTADFTPPIAAFSY